MDIVLKSEHNEKATAGNTCRIVKGADKIMGEIAFAERPTLCAPRAPNKKADRVQPAFQNLYQTKRREAPLSEGGSFILLGKALE